MQDVLWQTKKPLQLQNRADLVAQCTTSALGGVEQAGPHLHTNVVVHSSGGRSYFSLPCLCAQPASLCAAAVVQHALPGAGSLVGALPLPATEQGSYLESNNSHGVITAMIQTLHIMVGREAGRGTCREGACREGNTLGGKLQTD